MIEMIGAEIVVDNFDVEAYWNKRYRRGGNSGAGSYNHLAEFKSDVINSIIKKFELFSMVEFGCGDGNQLAGFLVESYTGFDLSSKAI